MLLPCEDNFLRGYCQDRPTQYVGRYDRLSSEIELSLAELLEAELALQRRTEILKRELEERYDCTVYACFRTIDKYNDGLIDTMNLRMFLRQVGHFATDKELLAIIRRLDTDGDAKVNYSEFSEGIRSSYPPSRPSKLELEDRERTARSQSASKPSRYSSSPLRSSGAYDTPKKELAASSSGFSDARTAERTGSRRKSPIKQENEDSFAFSLKRQIDTEHDLERAKERLAVCHDFNLFDAFRVFDRQARGYISFIDLKYGLQDIGIFAPEEDLRLYYKRYDKNGDGLLRFSEFCDSVSPQDASTAALLNRRQSNGLSPSRYPRDECFTYSTRCAFKDLWNQHFRTEYTEEKCRQELRNKPLFSAFDAFDACDVNRDGVVTKYEIKDLMSSKGFYVSDADASAIIDKYDKNKDGRISYSEFVDEVTPKSPVRI